MKINHKTLCLILASLCGTGVSADVLGQDALKTTNQASSGRIGDSSQPASSPRANAAPRPVATQVPTPVPYAETYVDSAYGSASGYYDGGYQVADGSDYYSQNFGYGSSSYYAGSSATTNVARCSPEFTWVDVEAILWWGKGISNSPMIVGSDVGSTSPYVLSGGEGSPLGTGMMPGMRATLGTWLDNDQNYGVSGRVYGLFGGDKTNTFSDSSTNNGVAFFRPDFGPDAYLVNLQIPGLGANTGFIRETNDLDFIGADLSLRVLLMGDTSSRVDVLGGYTFMRLDSHYGLETSITDGMVNTIPDGTVTTTKDSFGTKNEFHGGHLGLSHDITSGRFTLNLAGKVAMGRMKQSTNVAGEFSQAIPGLPVVNESRGLFAQPNNIGRYSDSRFTFLPEVNAKLKYKLGRGEFGVGYSLLVMPSVALAADQIDHTIDVSGIGGTMSAPQPKFSTDTYFLHGIDLGYTYKF